MRACFLTLLLFATCAAQEMWELYYAAAPQDTPTALEEKGDKLARHIAPLLPPGVRICTRPLPADCRDEKDTRRQEHAIASGVHTLPCLALRDAKGAYATLPLHGLTAESIAQAQQLATAPGREQTACRRREAARIFRLRFQWQQAADREAQDKAIAAFRAELTRPGVDAAIRQFIGFYCLYPALMQQYAGAYTGAHTPYTEAKLLEAIRALEEARDAEPTSQIGKRAYDERERLRAARLKSRQYE